MDDYLLHDSLIFLSDGLLLDLHEILPRRDNEISLVKVTALEKLLLSRLLEKVATN